MRIEFNAGFLNQFSVSVFKEQSFRFEESVDTVKDGFDNVVRFICNMNGGVGILQDAVDLVRSRAQSDNEKAENIYEARKKCADFLENVKRKDKQVAKKVRTNTKEFCKKYPRLVPKPDSKEKEKDWWEKGLDYLFKGAKAIYDWGKKKIKDVVNWATKKGKEFVDILFSSATKVVNWLVEKGRNIYDGLCEFFDFVYENFVNFVHEQINFWKKLLADAAEAFINIVEWTGEALNQIGERIGEICKAIGEFFSEHWMDLLDIVGGICDMVAGVVLIIGGLSAEVPSVGTSTFLVIGGGISFAKGWDSFWGGISNICGFEFEGGTKAFFQPTSTLESGLNDLLPGWHLGDIVGFAGDIVTIVAGGKYESIKGTLDLFSKVMIGVDSFASLNDFLSKFSSNDLYKGFSKLFSTGDKLVGLPDNLSELVRLLK